MEPVDIKEIAVENIETEPLLWCRALLDTNTFSVENNSVDVVWATDTPCLISAPDGELFYQVLSFDPSHVRMARIQTCGPVLDNHDSYGSVQEQLGIVENARIEGGEGRATLRFSKRDSLKPFVNDVKDGIIKGISARFRTYLYRDVTPDPLNDRYRTLLAIDWEPIEVTVTPIPEDYRSTVRFMSKTPIEAVIEAAPIEPVVIEPADTERKLTNDKTIIIKMEETAEEKTVRLAAEEKARNIIVNDERTRSLTIVEVANSVGIEPEFATEHVKLGTSVDSFRALAIDKIAAKQVEAINPNAKGVITLLTDRTAEARLLGFEEAITIRSFGIETLGKDGPKTEYGKKIANGGRRPTLADHGAMSLEAAGVNTSSMSEGDIFTRAMATGDFPIALSNVMNKNLRTRYNQADPHWKKFARKGTAKDFKPIQSVQVDGDFIPGPLTEKGEYPNVSFKEGGDKYQLTTDGLTFSMTRQLFINDDLGAFENFAPLVSDGFIYNQTRKVYAALLGANQLGRTLGEDNRTVFHANHNNYVASGSGAVPSVATLTTAQLAMRRQKTLAGRIMSGNVAKYIVIPPDLEVPVTSLLHGLILANTVANVNVFTNKYEILVEDFFTNTTAWLLVGDPSRIESVKYATLDGQEGIFTEQWWEPGKDCWKMKARNDFAATVEEYRGLYQNAGV